MKVWLACMAVIMFVQSGRGSTGADTAFIQREFLPGHVYHAIFFEKNKQSSFYTAIKKLIAIDPVQYERRLHQIQNDFSYTSNASSIKANEFKNNWYTVHLYKGRYVLYAASEPYFNTWIGISDSLVNINYFDDGVMPAYIKKTWRENQGTIVIETTGPVEADSVLKIHKLKGRQNVAVIEFPKRPVAERYLLVTTAEHFTEFPLIVNYCKDQRVQELEFETPDYVTILKKNR